MFESLIPALGVAAGAPVLELDPVSDGASAVAAALWSRATFWSADLQPAMPAMSTRTIGKTASPAA
jgi:hypothetical protein